MSSQVKFGYKLTDVGVIPEDWNIMTLRELTTEIGDGIHSTPTYSRNGEYSFINGNNLQDGRVFISDETKSVSYSEFKKHRKNIGDNSILMSINGTIGNLGLFSGEPIILGKSAAYLNLKNHSSRPFIYYALQSDCVKTQFSDGLTGTTIRNLGLGTIRDTVIPLPASLIEQRAISDALSDMDALISGLEQLIAKKRDIKQAAMQQLLTGKQRLPGFSGEWLECTFGEVYSGFTSGATPYRGQSEFYDGNIRWITSGELNYGTIYETNEKITSDAVTQTNLRVLPAGTFLMAITGLEAAGTRGSCGIVGAPSTTNQSCMAIFPTEKAVIEYLFHYYVLKGDFLALNYCQGTKQQSYTARIVKKLPITLPYSVEEQRAISAILSDMNSELAMLETRRDKARLLKQGMMQELLTGRTRLL